MFTCNPVLCYLQPIFVELHNFSPLPSPPSVEKNVLLPALCFAHPQLARRDIPSPDASTLPPPHLTINPRVSFDVYRFSAMTLCNLSTHADCKAALVSLHGLPPLIEMLEGESDLVKRYAAMALCNLSTLAINQV